MNIPNEKTTLYLKPVLKKFLQYRSLQEDRSMSDIINTELADLLEDFEDLQEIRKRRSEPTVSWEEVKQGLEKKHGL